MYDFSTESLTYPQAVETVTYHAIAAGVTASLGVYRNTGTIREQQTSDGAYFRESQMFLVTNIDGLGGPLPMPGDTISDSDSNLYKVQSVGGGWNGSAYQLAARRLGIQDFGHTVKYVRVTSQPANTAARVVSEDIGDPILCAIQPQVRLLSDLFGVKGTPQTYKIWIDGTLGQAITAGDMFEDENAVRYEIIAVSDRKRIDELAVFECIKKL